MDCRIWRWSRPDKKSYLVCPFHFISKNNALSRVPACSNVASSISAFYALQNLCLCSLCCLSACNISGFCEDHPSTRAVCIDPLHLEPVIVVITSINLLTRHSNATSKRHSTVDPVTEP